MNGAKVRLRQLTEEDAESLYRCWSDKLTARYLYLPPMNSPQDAKALIQLLQELSECEDSLRWGIELLDSGMIIGSCGYNNWQLQGAYRGEFGCELASAYWGNGYMSEAFSLAIEFGFQKMGLNRIEVLTDIHNERGSKFFLKKGFKHEGVLREYIHTDNGYVDVNIFALLRRNYGK